MPAITLFNAFGDVTLVWKPEERQKMRAYIQAKLDEGVSFFLIEQFNGETTYIATSDIETLSAAGRVRMEQAEEALLLTGTVTLARPNDAVQQLGRRTSDVEEILDSDTVAVKPIKGG